MKVRVFMPEILPGLFIAAILSYRFAGTAPGPAQDVPLFAQSCRPLWLTYGESPPESSTGGDLRVLQAVHLIDPGCACPRRQWVQQRIVFQTCVAYHAAP